MSFIELSTSWSLQILLIGLCAEACAPLLRKAHPGVRARFWLIALLLSLTAPWLMRGVPAATLKAEDNVLTVASTAVTGALGALPPSWPEIIVIFWGAMALARLIGLVRGVHQLAAITSESKPIEIAGSPQLRVRESASIQSPAASFIGRVILVPPNFVGLPDAWKRAALVHETIHLARSHGALLLLEEAILALFWFHPMVARLVRRVRDSREEMVDAATIAATGATREYREMLIGLAARIRIPAPAVSGTTALGARIESLIALEKNPMPKTSTPRLLAAGFALLCTAALASAAVPLGIAAKSQDSGDKKETKEAPRKVLSKVNPVYPPAMKEQKRGGVVVVTVTIGPDGTVKSLRPQPTPHEVHPDLVKAAVEALQQWRWESGKGTIEFTHAIDFRLGSDEKK